MKNHKIIKIFSNKINVEKESKRLDLQYLTQYKEEKKDGGNTNIIKETPY